MPVVNSIHRETSKSLTCPCALVTAILPFLINCTRARAAEWFRLWSCSNHSGKRCLAFCFNLLSLHGCILLPIFPHQDGVTIGLEVLLPKEAKLHADASPPLQYDVFLYKAKSYSSSHPTLKSPKTPKAHKSPRHCRAPPAGDREARHSSLCRRPTPGRHPSPTRHSAPGGYSPHLSPSRFQGMATFSSSTPPQPGRPRGPSQASVSECPPTGGGHQGGHIRPSPSSPHLTQPPPSPSRAKCSPVSTRSLPPLS